MGEFIDKAKGRIKQAVGALTGNKEMKRQGETDELKGKVKGVVNEVKDVKNAVADVVK